MEEENRVRCPYCGSTEISANKKGFSAGKAVAGGLLAGPVGLAAGGIGSSKVKCTCLKCGKSWNAGEKPPVTTEEKAANNWVAAILFLFIYLIYVLIDCIF